MKLPYHRNTKIIATIGPASRDYEVLLGLAKAGVNVFRLNFSHGTHEEYLEVIERICYINDKYSLHTGILADLQGPKLRVGRIKDNHLDLKEGDIVRFTNKESLGTKENIYMSYAQFAHDVQKGERVLLEISQIGKECHTRCNIYYQAGDCVMPKEGIFARVIKGGTVKSGDNIYEEQQRKYSL